MKFYIITCLIFISIGATAQNYTIENGEVKTNSATIQFKKGSAELLPQSDAAISIIKKYLEDKTYITTLRVEGHTNNDEKQLSEKRAEVVCKKLIAMGIDCKRLIAVGFGNTKPVADNSTATGKTANERILKFGFDRLKRAAIAFL